MKRTLWMTTVAFVLGVLWLLTGVAWADPVGPANVPQILNFRTFSMGSEQRTFRTSDHIFSEAEFYDPNPTCTGVSPVLAQLLLFNLEGQLLFTFDVTSSAESVGSKYQDLFRNLPPGAIPAGAYNLIFLVKDCTNVNIFVSGFQTIRVLAP